MSERVLTTGSVLACATFIILFGSPSAYSYDLDIGISGEVIAPPCVINSGQPIIVDFGDAILTSKVDGENYIQTLSYSLECGGRPSDAMKLNIRGEPASFDSRLLKTSNYNLGIGMFIDSNPLSINEWVEFSYASLPQLRAVPIKNAGSELAGGQFSAGATLLTSFQ